MYVFGGAGWAHHILHPAPARPIPALLPSLSALLHLATTYITPYCHTHKLLLTCPAQPEVDSIRINRYPEMGNML